jgi:hypothetical protein
VSKDHSFPKTKELTKIKVDKKKKESLRFRAQSRASKDSSLPRIRTKNKSTPREDLILSKFEVGHQKTPPSPG